MTVEDLHAVTGEHAGQCRRLADVLTLTRKMLDHAAEGDWDSVTAMEQRRRDDLRVCFQESTAPEHGELVAEALAVILHMNEELMAKLRAARDAVLQQGVDQARTRSAIGQYQNVKHAQG